MTVTLYVPGQTYWWFNVESCVGDESEFIRTPDSQEYWRTLDENIRIWNFKHKRNVPHWVFARTREEAISKLIEYREYLGLPLIHPMQFYP